MRIIITCEHGGNKIPREFFQLFNKHKNILASHRGYDTGALELADNLYKTSGDFFFHYVTSRLLIDLNRTVINPKLFSNITKPLADEIKEQIKSKHYFPYIKSVEEKVRRIINQNNLVIHISVHTFTPVLNGNKRKTDIGLLYDPQKKTEKKFCKTWKENITEISQYNVRFNYPYRGVADSLTSYFRKQFGDKKYIGVELEVNQKFLYQNTTNWETIKDVLAKSLAASLRHLRRK